MSYDQIAAIDPNQLYAPQPRQPMPMVQPAQMQPQQLPQQAMQNDPNAGLLRQILTQYAQDKQAQPDGGLIQQILSNRMQPNMQDTQQSITQTAQAYGAPELFRPANPNQAMGQRIDQQLAPYTTALGLNKEMAGTNLANAQADYYSTALQRDLAEKQFQYANDPAMAQAKMMAQYMGSLSGMPQPQAIQPGQGMVPDSGGALQQYRQQNGMATPPIDAQMAAQGRPIGTSAPSLTQTMQQNAAAQPRGGFNPMGAMLAKQLGLTDMQIGPDGQPMPIPGAMKIENGSVITIGPDGKPQSNIPVNPRAQSLFEQKLQDIEAKAAALDKMGGMVNENNGFFANKATQLAASQGNKYIPGGQDLLQGTEAQTLRDDISADVKQALPLYMQAFGITPGMERAQAAQQMLQEAIGGSLNKSRQHLISNLTNLSNTAGTGQLAQTYAALQQARDAIGSGADKAAVIQRLQGMGINPSGL